MNAVVNVFGRVGYCSRRPITSRLSPTVPYHNRISSAINPYSIGFNLASRASYSCSAKPLSVIRSTHTLRLPFGSITRYASDAKPFSRKKGGSGSSSSTSSSQVNYNQDFNIQATLAIVQIYRAVEGLVPMNKGYSLSTTSHMNIIEDAAVLVKKGNWAECEPTIRKLAYANEALSLTLGVAERGAYIFTVDREQERLNVQSPISGTYSYIFDVEEGLWLNAIDRHDMRGLVTRDLLRHCRGCPAF